MISHIDSFLLIPPNVLFIINAANGFQVVQELCSDAKYTADKRIMRMSDKVRFCVLKPRVACSVQSLCYKPDGAAATPLENTAFPS